MDTNSKIYWIIVDGQPRGPFTPEEIAARGVASPTLRVWRKGLPEWVLLPQLPELASLLGVVEESSELSENSEISEHSEPSEFSEPSEPAARPSSSWAGTSSADYEPMPPTYLPWNVLVTICCCIPVGIAGVIFSSQVSRKYDRGDLEGARQASERAAWCFIIAFTLGLVLWPFQMVFSL